MMPLLTPSEIPTGSLISKIHITNFKIFKITFFFFRVSCLLTNETGEGQPETVQKIFVNLIQITSNQAIAVE